MYVQMDKQTDEGQTDNGDVIPVSACLCKATQQYPYHKCTKPKKTNEIITKMSMVIKSLVTYVKSLPTGKLFLQMKTYISSLSKRTNALKAVEQWTSQN